MTPEVNPPEPEGNLDAQASEDAYRLLPLRARAFLAGEPMQPMWSDPPPRRRGLASFTTWPDEL
jgi:hypothetical protein